MTKLYSTLRVGAALLITAAVVCQVAMGHPWMALATLGNMFLVEEW